jgi:hypothetical protein
MRISITVNEDELPERFRQVFKILPQDVWRRRAVDLANRERQNDTQSSGSSIARWFIGRNGIGFRR